MVYSRSEFLDYQLDASKKLQIELSFLGNEGASPLLVLRRCWACAVPCQPQSEPLTYCMFLSAGDQASSSASTRSRARPRYPASSTCW